MIIKVDKDKELTIATEKRVISKRYTNFNILRVVTFLVFTFTAMFNSEVYCDASNLVKRSLKDTVQCIEDGRFYRNPDRPQDKVWTNNECAKYYLCLDSEVFEFKCSVGLLFDVGRQICDFKQNVDNCHITAETQVPKPLLDLANCRDKAELGCADGTCLPNEYFCDGSVDCPDGSDEGWCDSDHDPNAADPCDMANCVLPDCFCSKDSTLIPGQLPANQVPQMIVMTFDALNFENWDLYTQTIFTDKRKNPNGCPIRGTFFISHQYTNYQQVQKMWNDGHEIGVNSISHREPEQWWSKNATIEDWFDEMVGQANIINKFSSVRMEDLRGVRVPFLRVGWNRQFLMMKEFGFVYDASMVAPFSNPPLWPYTLDYKMSHTCTGVQQNCPSRSYPGIWEMVLNQLEAGEYTCGMIDSCPPHLSGEDIYRMLTHNFERHYSTNRAPLGLHFRATWFKNKEYLEAFGKFLDDMAKKSDVFFVTEYQAIQWMRNPTPVNGLNHFSEWDCKNRQLEPNEIACNLPKTCKLNSRIHRSERYLVACISECPAVYPWMRNEFGLA